MQSGKLRQRVTLQAPIETRDDYGDITTVWSTQSTVWAAVEPINGREYFDAAQVNAEISTRIRMRANAGADVSPKWRGVHKGNNYDIHAILEIDEGNREIHLMCSRDDE